MATPTPATATRSATITTLPEAGPRERRIHERVRLRDVAAALSPDTLVDVVGRGEVNPDGPQLYTNVEHLIVLEPDAYEVLRGISHFPPRSSALAPASTAQPRPSGVTALDLRRKAEGWAERAERYERFAAEGVTLGMSPDRARQLAELCRQSEAEWNGLADRLDSVDNTSSRKAA